MRQYNNISKTRKRPAVNISAGNAAIQNALRTRLVQATIKDINKEAYQKAISEQNEQLKQLENFAASLKAKFTAKSEPPQSVANAEYKQTSIFKRFSGKQSVQHVQFAEGNPAPESAQPLDDKEKTE